MIVVVLSELVVVTEQNDQVVVVVLSEVVVVTEQTIRWQLLF